MHEIFLTTNSGTIHRKTATQRSTSNGKSSNPYNVRNLRSARLLSCLLILSACGSPPEKPAPDKAPQPEAVPVTDMIPLYRDSVKKEPVAEYRVRTDNPLNDWYFQVQLYETPRTFHYLIKLQFEEIRGEDTLKLPAFGKLPEPVIKKGPEQYSCIVGFMDRENVFREYRKVYVQNEQLKITTLKQYGVSRFKKADSTAQ